MSCDPAAIDDPDVISQPLSLIHVVGSEHDGDPVMTHLLNDIPRMMTGVRIHPRGRFIEEYQLGAANQGGGKVDGLLLAAGEASLGGVRKRGNR